MSSFNNCDRFVFILHSFLHRSIDLKRTFLGRELKKLQNKYMSFQALDGKNSAEGGELLPSAIP